MLISAVLYQTDGRDRVIAYIDTSEYKLSDHGIVLRMRDYTKAHIPMEIVHEESRDPYLRVKYGELQVHPTFWEGLGVYAMCWEDIR